MVRYHQIIKYLALGFLAFVVDFGLLWFCKSIVGMHAWIAATIAFIVSTVVSFLTQRSITFKSTSRMTRAMIRYGILLFFNMVFTAVVVQAFDSWWDLYLVGKVVTTVVTAVWNYPAMKLWVYADK